MWCLLRCYANKIANAKSGYTEVSLQCIEKGRLASIGHSSWRHLSRWGQKSWLSACWAACPCAWQGLLSALAMDTSTQRARVSVRPPTGGSSFAMSTRAIARIRRREPLLEGTGRMRRARIIVPMALSVTGWKGTGVSFPSSGTGGRSTTAPPTSRRMVQHGAQLVSGEKIERQFVAVSRTAQLRATMVPAHT